MNSDFCVAVHALVYLSHKDGILSSEELAANICTNPVRIRRVMAKLKKAGLIETKEGTDGGYRFLCDASKVSLAQVAASLEVKFVSTNWHSGDMDKPCFITSGMAAVMDELLDELDDSCKKKLQTKTVADICSLILENNNH